MNTVDGSVISGLVQTGSVRDVVFNPARYRTVSVSVDFSRVPHLIGRDDEFDIIAESFADPHPSRPIVRVLAGESGTGKSALVRGYGNRHQSGYDIMWWIDARDIGRIADQCRNLLNIVAPGEGAVDNPVDVLHGHLANQAGRWLLVLDDVRHPQAVRRLIPAAGPGNVIITSTAAGWADTETQHIAPLAFEAAASLLRHHARALPEPAVRAMAACIGGLPRSLIRAADDLGSNTAITWTDYLRLHAEGRTDLGHRAVTARPVRGTLAAGSLQNGHQELFVVDNGRRLVHRCHDLEPPYGSTALSGWSRWWPLDEPESIRQVACSSLHAGHVEVFVLTDDRGLIHRWREGDPQRWSRWRVLTTPGPVAGLAAGSSCDGHQDLFVVTTDGKIFIREFPDNDKRDWSAWSEFGPPDRHITALAWSGMDRRSGHGEVFAVTTGGNVVHRWKHRDNDSEWRDWVDFACPGTVQAAAAGSSQRWMQDLVVILNDGTVFVRRFDGATGGWTPDWTPMSADEPIAAITSSSSTPGHLELFATTKRGALLHRWYWPSDGWSQWEPFEWAPQVPEPAID